MEKEKWTEPYLDDPYFSLLPDLKKRIESGKEVSGVMGDLRAVTVKGYLDHLSQLEKESWVNKGTVKEQREQLIEIASDSLSHSRSLSNLVRR